MNLKKFLWINKEGAAIGAAWGAASPYVALGFSTLDNVTIFHKFLILPTMIADMLIQSCSCASSLTLAVPILVGMALGILIDMFYYPSQ